jgi:hypothetical protein
MSAIRSIPTGLLLLTGALNLFLGIITRPDPSFGVYLIFSIVYFALGVLLISKIRFAELIGLIFTLAILFIYPLIVEFKNLDPWSSGIMGAIDAIVIICCLILLLLKF